MPSLIEVNNIYKVYHAGEANEVRALGGITLRIDRGEFVAIVGSSGSGKSTLMNILGCLDIPSYGEYILDGKPVWDYTDRELSVVRNEKIGFIFQGYNLIADLNAVENVELPLLYRGMRRKSQREELAVAALKKVGLEGRMKHRPSEMSGGQQQRVAIARAIATRPPIIMADEPTGNLDSRSGAEVMELLKGFHREGTTVILITHDNGIADMAERAVRIQDGHIVSDVRKGAGA